jgi:pimeloyl-ACP methyl ester carboxylesterase
MKAAAVFLFIIALQLNAMSQIRIVEKELNGLKFQCRVAGDEAGEPVMLLHGWPETSHMWIPLMERLAAEGFYCVAPDQRGFSPDARPEKVKDYTIEILQQDVMSLADSFGMKNLHLVGHDWGSAIGWAVVNFNADRVKSWSALSVPHVRAFSEALRFDKKQKKMSQYMALFQWRGIPEWYLLKKDRLNLRKTWKKSPADQLAEYLEVIGNKPALKATLAYYRANYKTLKKGQGADQYGDVSVPSIFIWGKKDIAIGRIGAEGTGKFMKGPYEFIELEAGHWLMQEAFEETAVPIINHLKKYR